MERYSSAQFSEHRNERLRTVSQVVNIQANRLIGWISEKSRQIRSIAGNDYLLNALVADDKAPVEGTRFPIGQHLHIHHPDGTDTRLKVCGVRSGGFSNVYTVIDLDEMRPYSLKENRATPGDEAVKNEKLAAEAELSLLLGTSPHLVSTVGAFRINSRLFLLLEHHRSSLEDFLRHSALPLDRAITYAVHICRGMIHAQKMLPGFAHGDIKPGNCLISTEGLLKLGDFGLASADSIAIPASGRKSEDADSAWGYSSGIEWGTTAYMAPELFGHGPVRDRRSADVYAFGVTLFEMVCGTRPFVHSTKERLVQMHCTARPPLDQMFEKGIPLPLIELIDQCLSKSPADRPAGFELIQAELCAIYRQECGQELPPQSEGCPENADVTRKALAFSVLGKPELALAVIEEAITEGGTKAELLASKAIIMSEAGRTEQAYAASTAALMMDAKTFNVLVAHARVLTGRGKPYEAEEYLRRALVMQPDNCVVLNLLACICLNINDIERARNFLERSLKIDGAQPQVYDQLAKIALAERDFDHAAALASRSASVDPLRAESYEILASAQLGCDRTVEALRSFKSALGQADCAGSVRHKFARACLAVVDASGAEPSGKLLRSLLRAALILQRRIDEKSYVEKYVESFIAVLEESKFDPQILFFHDLALARAMLIISFSTSEHLYRTILNCEGPSADGPLPFHLSYSLGRIFYHLDKLEDCKRVFLGMLEHFGPNESSYYYLGACAEIELDLEASLKLYRKANRLFDCEDSRTGIRRVRSRLKELRGNGRNAIF